MLCPTFPLRDRLRAGQFPLQLGRKTGPLGVSATDEVA